ncbi:MAG: hypothetical protein GQ547_07515 [Methylophaga sp.]|nr:hypothetical protein [Methylophaga sp.]
MRLMVGILVLIRSDFSILKIVTLIPTFSLKGEGAKLLAPSPVGEGWGEEIKLRRVLIHPVKKTQKTQHLSTDSLITGINANLLFSLRYNPFNLDN